MPFSHLYGKLTNLRNHLYDRGALRTFSLGARTISVGNITTGGTGKTPLVAYIARNLADRGEKVCILTRGYGRRDPRKRVVVSDGTKIITDPAVAGDEPVELAISLGDKAIIVADPDRVAAAEWARGEFGVTAFILDDGFQHRRARRDVDIVCIDATDPWGGGKTMPGGRLREPLSGLERASIIVITRSDLVSDIEDLRSEISNLNPEAAVFAARNQIVRVYAVGDATEHIVHDQMTDPASRLEIISNSTIKTDSEKIRLMAFCGIGNPEGFFRQILNACGDSFELADTQAFPDHHHYRQSDIVDIEKRAGTSNADALVTTVKDAVKLKDLQFTIPCYAVEVSLVLDKPEAFAQLI